MRAILPVLGNLEGIPVHSFTSPDVLETNPLSDKYLNGFLVQVDFG